MQSADDLSQKISRPGRGSFRLWADRPASGADEEHTCRDYSDQLGSLPGQARQDHPSRLSKSAGTEEGASGKDVRNGTAWVIRKAFLKSEELVSNAGRLRSGSRTGTRSTRNFRKTNSRPKRRVAWNEAFPSVIRAVHWDTSLRTVMVLFIRC